MLMPLYLWLYLALAVAGAYALGAVTVLVLQGRRPPRLCSPWCRRPVREWQAPWREG